MRTIGTETINGYIRKLNEAERSAATVEKYLRSIRTFAAWLNGGEVTKESVIRWKAVLLEQHYAPVTVNVFLSALNGFFRAQGWDDCRVSFLKVQRRLFREQAKELNREEYLRLLRAARSSGKKRIALVMETICGTGIRVSELRSITVEAVDRGVAEIRLKGKIREILLPGKLCAKLRQYARRRSITSGPIFVSGKGVVLSRRKIWGAMKALCRAAGVAASKVFPHNLRHLFARTFYKTSRDIVRLADILGHSSIETTRIYLLTTGEEHARELDRLQLVL